MKKESDMNKLKWLRILNVFVIFGFLVVALSIALYLPSLSPLYGNDMLREIHEIGGRILIILIIVHLILNWNWIQMQYLKKKKPTSKPVSKKTK